MKLFSKAMSASGLTLKSIYFSIRDAVAYRGVRDANKDVTINFGDVRGGTPGVNAALQLSVVWSCVRLIAETIATLPLITYERKVVNGREIRVVAREHPLYYLLHDSPNADMTAVEFWEAVVSQICLWGNAYCLKSYGAAGRIVALDPLNPALMTVRRSQDGAVSYLYADPRGQKEFTEDEIWHIKGFGTDGLVGISPITAGWRSMCGATAAENASANTFGKGMRLSGVLTMKEYLDPAQREQAKGKVMGAVFGDDRTGNMMLLEGATEFTQLSMHPADAQMLETRSFSVEDLCRWFGMPPSMIGHGTAVSNWGTGREQINQNFIDYVLRAYMKRIEQGIAKSLLKPAERMRFFSEYSVEGLLRGDSASRAALYSTMTQNGIYTRNFCRSLENLEPLPGGDELTVQSNLIPLSLLGKITNTAQAAKSAVLSWLGIKENDDANPPQID
ncbi:phage portal protein [Massilia pseudoviolaceinigra]|uniref:phage portal protein n=1 Tax=Massilia pseudoviolaceinigra TaxID=3057165 RepID=UPI002796984C|nr:phage portal protein [Massilia sp. CCM 9206]MDQ1924679.1 phage portal protein [Massilia sp. CCM 9206]